MTRYLALAAVMTMMASGAQAARTVNQSLRVLPAPGPVAVDGQTGDWDLSGGVCLCNDVPAETATSALWLHAMYDGEQLYVLAHFRQPYPLANRFLRTDAALFNDDCLRLRLLTDRPVQVSAALDREGQPVLQLVYDDLRVAAKSPAVDGLAQGARLAARRDADGQGYTLELALPWKLLSKSGKTYGAGESFRLIAQGLMGFYYYVPALLGPFAADSHWGMAWLDPAAWGEARLLPAGKVTPLPVRLDDGRECPVSLQADGLHAVLPAASAEVQPLRIVFAGDSITGWSDRSQWLKFSELVGLMLEAHAGPDKYTVANRGWGGDSTTSLLARLDQDVLVEKPEITVLLIGGNDPQRTPEDRETTRQNLEKIVTALTGAGSKLLVLQYHVLNNPENPDTIWHSLAGNNDLVAAVATRHGLPLLNMGPLMQQALDDYRREELCNPTDGVHLNPAGEMVYARAIYARLRELGWVQ
jgi:lysophospholipase L1-like esterase